MMAGLEMKDLTLRLHGGNLALGSDPTEVWTTSPTVMAVNTWTEMFHFIFQPPGLIGKIVWIYIYLKYRVRATTVTADVDERVRARNIRGREYLTPPAYINISNELATANIGTNWVTRITSGYVFPTPQSLDEVPFELQVQMRTNEVDTGRLEVSSESYIRVVYKEK
jgi:hypothetical protein